MVLGSLLPPCHAVCIFGFVAGSKPSRVCFRIIVFFKNLESLTCLSGIGYWCIVVDVLNKRRLYLYLTTVVKKQG